MEYHLAQINIGRILGPMDSPIMAEFAANLEPINTLAENSEGFVWRLKDDSNNATDMKYFEDDAMIVNMSVWKSIEALSHYVYKTAHAEIFKKRNQWFEKMREMHMVLWYIPATHTPTVAEAMERLEYRRKNGDTPYAFTFKKKYTPDEAFQFQAG